MGSVLPDSKRTTTEIARDSATDVMKSYTPDTQCIRNPFQGCLQTVGIRDTMARVTSTSRPPRVTRASSETRLDDIAKHIIELLQDDGRQSYAAIAKAVGLSEAAVRQRVQRLLDADVMQIVAVTDPLQVGFSRQAMIGIRVSGDLLAVGDALTAMPEVDYVVTTAGSFDILAEVVCEDDDHLLDLLNQQIRTLPGVTSTETFVYLKLNKQHYNWGTR
ncbi:AsnC family transcriptional regulator [Ornithinibacter aureus]|nr:AsnC family transcriptional regulator [Ornithinibacter aureus]